MRVEDFPRQHAGASAAGQDDRALFERIGAFLADHRLGIDPATYGFAHTVITQPDGDLARAVARLTDGGVRLSQADIEALGGASVPIGTGARSSERDQLAANAQMQVEGFADIVRTMRAETTDFAIDIAARAEAIRRTRESARIDEAVDIAGAMVTRTRSAESRLDAATREAEALRRELEKARDNARRDPLTDLPNRRALEESFATRPDQEGPACLAICDIDRFKHVNDRFGHAVGDRVLRAVGEALSDICHGHLVARYGGEEFAILFTAATLEAARATLDTARIRIAAKSYRVRDSGTPLGEVTFSAGLTPVAAGETLADVLVRADALLYAAKADGRNCLKTG